MTKSTPTIPMDPNAEEGVIGAILRNPKLIDDVRILLHPQMLSSEKLKTVYVAMCKLNDASKPLDSVTIADQVRSAGDFGGWDIDQVLRDARLTVPTSATGLYHAAIVSEKAKARNLISVCEQILHRAYDGEIVTTLLEDLQRQAGEIAEAGVIDLGKTASELVDPVWNSMMGTNAGECIPGLSTGLPELDNAIGGLKPKHLVVAAAFAKVGKTALGLNIAAHFAIRLKTSAAVISYEMSAEELTERLIVSECGLPAEKLRSGRLPVHQRNQIEETKAAIRECRLVLDDTAPSTISGLRIRLRTLKRLHKIQFAVVDYYQLLNGDDPKARRYDQLVHISRSLKQLANELNIPILVLAQLNAESQTTERTPSITDIADCKAIARDANCVLILDRPAERHKADIRWLQFNADNLTAATIDIAAIRNGQPAVIQCHYIGEIQRWRTASQQADARLDAAYDQAAEYQGEPLAEGRS